LAWSYISSTAVDIASSPKAIEPLTHWLIESLSRLHIEFLWFDGSMFKMSQ
jgi:hypothetical protein